MDFNPIEADTFRRLKYVAGWAPAGSTTLLLSAASGKEKLPQLDKLVHASSGTIITITTITTTDGALVYAGAVFHSNSGWIKIQPDDRVLSNHCLMKQWSARGHQ